MCRIINRSSKFASICPKLKELHWLPVEFRIQFKICLLIYKTIHSGYPKYLLQYLTPYVSQARTRRSSPNKHFLNAPFFVHGVHKSFSHLKLSFVHYAPRLWNDLPLCVRTAPSIGTFRQRLKSHLFALAYPP